MSTALDDIQTKLGNAKSFLNDLLGHLQQLKESAHSAYLENTRSGAESGDEGKVNEYKSAIENIYGVTINVEFWGDLEPLEAI